MPNYNQSLTETPFSLTEALGHLTDHYLGDAYTYLGSFVAEVNGVSLGSITGIDVNGTPLYAAPTVTIEVNGFGISGDVGPQDFEKNSTLLVFSDVVTLNDTTITKATDHILYDTIVLNDTLTHTALFYRYFAEASFALNDSITKADTHILTDAAPIMDMFNDYLSWVMSLTDTVVLNDVEHNSTSTNLFTATAFVETVFSKNVRHPLSDPFLITETLNSDQSTEMYDTIGLVEFYANASSVYRNDAVIPVETSFTKAPSTNLADAIALLDSYSAGWSLEFGDALSLSDSYNAATNLHLFDVNGTMETINFSTGSGQSDTITLSDLENNSKATTFTDTFVPTESIELLYEIFLHVADAVVPVDSFSISQNLGRYYTDTIVLIDSINFDTDSNQYDVITLTDSLTSYSFRGAFFTDALTITDASNLSTDSNQTDAVTVADLINFDTDSNQNDLISIFDYLSDYVAQVLFLDEDPIVFVEAINFDTVTNLADDSTLSDTINFSTSTGWLETFTVTDTFTSNNSRDFTYSDTVTFNDSYNAATVSNQSDASVLADSWSYNGTFNDTYSDSISLTEAVNFGTVSNQTDTLALSDAFAYLKSVDFTYSDALTVADAINFDTDSNQTDTTSVIETINSDTVTNLYDEVTLVEFFSALSTLNAAFTDAFTLSDSFSTMATLFRSLTDSLTLADSESSNSFRLTTFTDAYTLVDTLTAGTSFHTAFADALTVADSHFNSSGKFVTDTTALVDSHNTATVTNLFDLDQIFDYLFNNDSYTHSVSDSISLADSLSRGAGKLAIDQVTLISVTMNATAPKALSDTLSIVEAFAHSEREYRTFTDEITVIESLAKRLALPLYDSFTITDSISFYTPHNYLTLVDTITLVDVFASFYSSGDDFKHTFKYLEEFGLNGFRLGDWIPALGRDYNLILKDLDSSTSYTIYVNANPLGVLTVLDVNGNPTTYVPGDIIEVNSEATVGTGGIFLEESITKTPGVPVAELPFSFVEGISTIIAHGPLVLSDSFELVDSLYTSPLSDVLTLSEQFYAIKATMLQFVATPRLDLKYPVLISWMRGTKAILPSGMPWGFLAQSTGIGSLPVPTSYFDAEETPAGTLGTTGPFTLSSIPTPSTSLQLYKNGNLLALNLDYTINNNVITFEVPTVATDVLLAVYQGVLS